MPARMMNSMNSRFRKCRMRSHSGNPVVTAGWKLPVPGYLAIQLCTDEYVRNC